MPRARPAHGAAASLSRSLHQGDAAGAAAQGELPLSRPALPSHGKRGPGSRACGFQPGPSGPGMRGCTGPGCRELGGPAGIRWAGGCGDASERGLRGPARAVRGLCVPGRGCRGLRGPGGTLRFGAAGNAGPG